MFYIICFIIRISVLVMLNANPRILISAYNFAIYDSIVQFSLKRV